MSKSNEIKTTISSLADANHLVTLLTRLYPRPTVESNWDRDNKAPLPTQDDSLVHFILSDVADCAEGRESHTNLEIAMDYIRYLHGGIKDLQATLAGFQSYVVTSVIYEFFAWVRKTERYNVDVAMFDAWITVYPTHAIAPYIPEIKKVAATVDIRLAIDKKHIHPGPMSVEDVEKILAMLGTPLNMEYVPQPEVPPAEAVVAESEENSGEGSPVEPEEPIPTDAPLTDWNTGEE